MLSLTCKGRRVPGCLLLLLLVSAVSMQQQAAA
jgi:hypothetical protein